MQLEDYGRRIVLDLPFHHGVALTADALQHGGFHIGARINVRDELKRTLDHDFRHYVLFVVWSPEATLDVLMEDLGFCQRGSAVKEVLAGTFDLEGELAVNPDGGLKSFGHPIGASGLRMLFEAWLQLRGEAGKRQIASGARGRKLALTHNLGGAPGECVSFVAVVGSEKS